MNMLLMIDNLARRYHCLPSEALFKANTHDMFIMNQSLGYYHRLKNPEAALPKVQVPQKKLTHEDRLAIIAERKRKEQEAQNGYS